MKKIKVVLLILLASACFNSCSKDDDKLSDDEAIDGGTIYTSELVRIAAEGLSQDLYDATFNGVSVQLVNNDQDELLFFVQSDLAKLNENNVLEIAGNGQSLSFSGDFSVRDVNGALTDAKITFTYSLVPQV